MSRFRRTEDSRSQEGCARRREWEKENRVKSGKKFRIMGATLACAGLAVVGTLISSPRGRADDQGDEADSRIERGFEIAPVPLNLEGKNPALVGLGSYIVNTEGCNDCHSAGLPRNMFVAAIPSLASRRRLTRRPTSEADGISVPFPDHLPRTLFPGT